MRESRLRPLLRRGACAALMAFSACTSSASAETLRVTYAISLLSLPIGGGHVNAKLTPTSYAIDASAELNALARLVNNARGASTGHGALVAGRVSPVDFATTAVSPSSTRTIRMSIRNNAVAGVDIAPPFGDSPDRVPVRAADEQNIVDPVGAYIFPAPKTGPAISPAACDRTVPIFDGWTRFDLQMSYAGEAQVKAKGYKGPVAKCNVRYVPISGHRPSRAGTKFMAENKEVQIWLAPVEGAGVLAPFRVSLRTMVGMLAIDATEFAVEK